MSFPIKTIALILLAALPLGASALERADLIPPKGQTYVRVSNTVDFWEKLKKSALGKLWVDQQFQDFLGHPNEEIWLELFFKGEPNAENKVMIEQLKMLKGEVVVSLDREKKTPCIIAAMSKEDFNRSLDLDDNLKGMLEDPFELVKSTFQGIQVIKHINKENVSWQAHVNNTLILGYSKEWLEQSIVRLKKEAITEPKGIPEATLNVPIAPFIEDSFRNTKAGIRNKAIYKAFGLLGIKSLNCVIQLQDEQMIVNNNLSITDLEHGILTVLDTKPANLPSVTFIPESIASLEVGRFNLLNLWHEIPTILLSAQPNSKPQFDMMLGMIQQQAGIDFEQDLLAHLGTKYVAFAVTEEAEQSSVIAVELKDGIAFKKGLETALSSPAFQPYVSSSLEISDFLDHTIYSLKNMAEDNQAGIAVINDYLLYGNIEGLHQVIRTETSESAPPQSIERTKLVKGLCQHVSENAFGFSAIDWKKNMDVIIHELTKPSHIIMAQQKWAQSGSPLPPPDFNKLPSSAHISEFFNVSYQYVEASSTGLHQKIILKY